MRRALLTLAVIAATICTTQAQNPAVQNRSRATTAQQQTQPIYDPTDYSAVERALDRASRPTLAQRIGSWLSKPQTSNDSSNLTGRIGIAYTQETNAAITASATAHYGAAQDKPLSEISASAMVSINGFFDLRATGHNYFRQGRNLLSYEVGGGSLPQRFWGIGYKMADHAVRSKYTRHRVDASANYLYLLEGGISVGAGLDMRFDKAADFEPLAEEYLSAGNHTLHSLYTTGIGITARYDRRDNAHTTTRGGIVTLYGEVRPEVLGNYSHTLWQLLVEASYFQSVWRGGVVALDLYSQMWSKHTPWLYYPAVGGSSHMRGYYYGRYSDRNMITAQVELRQTIYGPFGVCVWGGGANLFPRWSAFSLKETLPNVGVGLRLSAGGRTTLRIDYGWGRHSQGLIVNVNEAF